MTEEKTTQAPLGPLYLALAKAQGEMGGGVTKDSTNPHFRNQYASLAAVLDVVVPALSKYELALIQYRDDAQLVTELVHSSGAGIGMRYPLKPSKDNEQGWGSAITYARRYQAMAICALAPEDDDGHSASAPRQSPDNNRGSRPGPAGQKAAAQVQASIGGTVDTERGRVFAELAAQGVDEQCIERAFNMHPHEAYKNPDWGKFHEDVMSGRATRSSILNS